MLNAVRNIGSFPKGVIFSLCAAIFWGSMAVAAQAVMANGVVNAGALVIVRLCSSGGLLLLWCCITARNEIVKIFTSWTNFRDVLFGAVFIYGGQFAFMLAIHYSNAGAAAIVLTTVPLWVALWEMIVNRSKPSPRMVICFLLAAVGVTLIVTKGEFDVSQFNLTGLTWAIICAVMTAGYSVQPRQLLKRVAVMPVMGSAMLFGGLMAVVASFFLPATFDFSRFDWMTAALLFHVVFFGTLMAFCLYMTALRLISPVIASILSLGEPVSAYLLSVLVMGLDVGLIEGIGVVMVLATVVLLAKTPRKSNEGENIAPRWKSQN